MNDEQWIASRIKAGLIGDLMRSYLVNTPDWGNVVNAARFLLDAPDGVRLPDGVTTIDDKVILEWGYPYPSMPIEVAQLVFHDSGGEVVGPEALDPIRKFADLAWVEAVVPRRLVE